MSGRQSPGLDGLFGYSMVDGNESQKPNSRQPTGPPLLDDQQSDLLQSFFQNPDDVSSEFLSANEFAHSGAGENMYSGQHFSGWMFNGAGAQDLPAQDSHSGPSQFPAAPQSHTRPGSQDFGSVGNHSGPMTPSDDVWAAAQMLHGPNSHHQVQQFNGSRQDILAYNSPHPSSSFNYNGAPQHGAAQFNFNHPQSNVSNGIYGPAGFRQQAPAANMPPFPFPQTLDSSQNRPTLPLKFGSDDHFRSDSFKAPGKFEPPDQAFRDTINHNFRHAENNPLGINPLSSGSNSQDASPVRKRGRQIPNQENHSSAEGAQSSDEEERITKRQKSKTVKKEQRDSPAIRGQPQQAPSNLKGKAHETQALASPITATSKSNNSPFPNSKSRRRPSVPGPVNNSFTPGPEDDSKPSRENLTEEQKRNNHIQSEQKRRNLIKQGFEDINRMVPELRSGGFSKSNMLVETAKFMKVLLKGNDELKAQLKALDNG